ncbi:MAG TPA: imidazole glycerol phosphate synthase subunit HisH [Chitinispirillaceae bacterium]|nr:imidazole glycerol phosphate synthase subunit HisH [Chitinispirillaceae bacterium]
MQKVAITLKFSFQPSAVYFNISGHFFGDAMITIVDYEAGNLTSVKRALDYLSIKSIITPDPDIIRNAEKIIFPGVGHAASAMTTLKERGIDVSLHEAFNKGTPILGICLGTQIILTHSEEGDTECLGIIDGETRKFLLTDPLLKIPHMGWNTISIKKQHPMLKGIADETEFYFVHSFYPQPSSCDNIVAECEYELRFPAAIAQGTLFATQFHPEKSGAAGLAILDNFATWNGESC